MNKILCPDCGGSIESHNAVNRIPGGKIAHSANGGACWKSLNTPFVSAVERSINDGSYTNEHEGRNQHEHGEKRNKRAARNGSNMTDQHNCRACGDPATHRLFVPNGVDGALTKRIARILGVEVGDRVCMRCFCNALTMVQIENEGVTENLGVCL